VTLVNVFTVEPAKQEELVRLLIDATRSTMKHAAGLVSASIHRSLDGKRVINYAQWKSVQDFEAMRQNPEAQAHMAAAAALGTFEPTLCEVVESIGPND
jgi:quinol monooxygenase YgiN